MRASIEIPDELMRQAEAQAAREGVQLRDLIERGLRLVVAERRHTGRRRVSLPLLPSTRSGTLTAEAVRSAQDGLGDVAAGMMLVDLAEVKSDTVRTKGATKE
jgi:hypothetical protein